MEKEKIFINPILEIITFPKEDVIATSGEILGEWWEDGPVEQGGGGDE